MVDVDNYNENRGFFPLIEHNGGCVWVLADGEQLPEPVEILRAYPPSYLKRIRLLFLCDVQLVSDRSLHTASQ